MIYSIIYLFSSWMLSWVYQAVITLIVIVSYIRYYCPFPKFLAVMTNLSVFLVSWALSIIFGTQELTDKIYSLFIGCDIYGQN